MHNAPHDTNGQSANGAHGSGDWFHHFAVKSANAVGRPWAFLLAVLIIVLWAVSGPIFHFTDTWQLVINTGTTIVTFLMVFLIQNTQNRDAKAIHLKLDELLRAVKGARTRLVNLEEMSDREMAELHEEFERVKVRAEARSHAAHGRAERADHKAENAEQAARSAHGKAEEASEAAREAKEVAERARDARG